MKKRLDLDDPKVWDKWRGLYYDLTEEENIQFGNDIFARYPGQASFNPAVFEPVFAGIETPVSVLEFGGWRGELAVHCFNKFPGKIEIWHGFDMCKAAVDNSVCTGFPYIPHFPGRFDWWNGNEWPPPQGSFDVFFSAHAIEHLTDKHALELLDWVKGTPLVVLEIPITADGQKWDGYGGTHILELGWNQIHDHMKKLGYSVERVTDIAYAYRYAR